MLMVDGPRGRRNPHHAWIRLVFGGLALIVMLAGTAVANERPRVLTLVEADSRLPLGANIIAGMEEVLGIEFMTRGETYVEYLDMFRFDRPEQGMRLRELLLVRYSDKPPDLLVVLGRNALRFAIDNREALAPGAPIVFAAISEVDFASIPFASDVTGIAVSYEPAATVQMARRLQPDAEQLVIVTGAGDYDRRWFAVSQKLFGDEYEDLAVRHLAAQPLEDILTEVAALDRRSIVLILTLAQDALGRRFIPREAVDLVATASGAPAYGVYDTYVGYGVVGGVVYSSRETGRAIGELIGDILDGGDLPPVSTLPTYPVTDWRMLERWEMDASLLPAGTRIEFHEPTIWQRYRTAIMIVAAIILAQTLTIGALILQSRRYHRARESLALEREQLVHVSRNLRLGQLSAALAHEINQPLAAILANAEAGSRFMRRDPPKHDDVSDIFDDISADVRRAGSIISGLRRLIVKGETQVETVDLNDIVRTTLALLANEFQAKGARVEPALTFDRLWVEVNAAQLQQIVLNLVLNAAEAVAGLPSEQRVVAVATRRLDKDAAELSVADRGPGVDADQREEVFRPFYSTKESGLGIGLAICRNIAIAHGGTLAFVDPVQEGVGARIVLTLPPVARPT